MKTHTLLLLLGLVIVLASGCGGQIATPTPGEVSEKPQTEATVPPSLTATPAEVASLAQAAPTAIPAATDTPSPTDTPNPVELPPTPTPEPPTPTAVASRRDPPRTRNTTPEGNCGDDFDCDLVLLPDGFVRAKVRNTSEDKDSPDGKGISHVDFAVFDGGNQVHKRTERNAGYCIFGGGEPHCNLWPVEGDAYKWPDGARVEAGREYSVLITAIADDGQTAAYWSFQASFDLPE